MTESIFDISELDNLSKKMLKLANSEMPRECKKFIKKEGNKLKKITKSNAKSLVKRKTGEYVKGIKSGKSYKYSGMWSNRVYSTSPHAHLIENGHRIVKNKKEYGFVEGKHVFERSGKIFENEFVKDVEDFINNVVVNKI